MKAPTFWNKKNWQAWLLFPLGCLYASATSLRMKLKKPYKANVPVICIGNLTAGGSGKTPTAISIAKILQKQNKNPFFISRGYGGTLQDVVVNKDVHSAEEVGDEPLLLARQAGVVVNHKRDEAARKAIEEGADIIIMDDGLQNPLLYKDKSIVVVDGAVGLGNGLPIPSGPMREFFSVGIKRADAIVMLGDDVHQIAAKAPQLPVFKGKVVPVKPMAKGAKVVAFAGIGRPNKFYQSLQDCNFEIVKTYSFPDHHFYTNDELQQIIKEAEFLQADIYTTAKDMVKIPYKLQPKFKVLDITIDWEDEKALQKFLLNE